MGEDELTDDQRWDAYYDCVKKHQEPGLSAGLAAIGSMLRLDIPATAENLGSMLNAAQSKSGCLNILTHEQRELVYQWIRANKQDSILTPKQKHT